MRLTTITTYNNYNKIYLKIPKIYNLKFINLRICCLLSLQDNF